MPKRAQQWAFVTRVSSFYSHQCKAILTAAHFRNHANLNKNLKTLPSISIMRLSLNNLNNKGQHCAVFKYKKAV
jgi:hypothetical protein